MTVMGLDVPRFASRRGARDLHSNAVAAPGNSCAGRFMSQCRGRRPLILRSTRGHTHHEAWRPVAFCATSGLITLARRWFPACEVPFLTDDARQFGRGCVCACPYQGASRGCRPGSGAARVSLRPVPNGPRRSAHPKRRSPGEGPSSLPLRTCATWPAVREGSRSLYSAAPLDPCQDAAQPISEPLECLLSVGGPLHAHEDRSIHVQVVGPAFQELGNVQ